MKAVTTAVILAAGVGSRLGEHGEDTPKGLLEIGGETLVGRSIRLLQERGIRRVVIVGGHCCDAYRRLADELDGVGVVENERYAETGSMTSLACALDVLDEDVLVLESDLYYEPRALDVVLSSMHADVVLLSGPTGATDEVWVEAPGGALAALSKDRAQLGEVTGEYVGIIRVSRELAGRMKAEHERRLTAQPDARVDYETDALAAAAREIDVATCVVPDLRWGEVDDALHLLRVRDHVAPLLASDDALPALERNVLLNPGPATTSASVKRALLMPDECPREQATCDVLADVLARLARIAGSPDEVVAIPVVGSGTAALESALVSFVPDDGHLLVLGNGDYGTRLADIAAAHGLPHELLDFGWGQPLDVDAIDERLAGRTITHVAVVHHETSTGMLNPLEPLVETCSKRGARLLVDAMSSFGALPTPVGAGDADAVVSSANKCVQGMAGLSFVVATRTLLDEARDVARRSLYFDLRTELEHVERSGQMRFTVPPQVLNALHRALMELEAEGVSARRERYGRCFDRLLGGARELGFEPLLADEHQSRILLTLRAPDEPWWDFTRLHDALRAHGFTIYPGKTGHATETWRLSVLGDLDELDVSAFLIALRHCVAKLR